MALLLKIPITLIRQALQWALCHLKRLLLVLKYLENLILYSLKDINRSSLLKQLMQLARFFLYILSLKGSIGWQLGLIRISEYLANTLIVVRIVRQLIKLG
jgi:hypothetical protein